MNHKTIVIRKLKEYIFKILKVLYNTNIRLCFTNKENQPLPTYIFQQYHINDNFGCVLGFMGLCILSGMKR